jgi:F420-dependent oxidoreductase-like protein
VKVGLHVSDFTWPGGAPHLRDTLTRIAATADRVGFDRLSVMDHFFQIGAIGPPEHEMLEAYTTLGFLAAHTSKVKLLTLVTGVIYRQPGLLAKAVTTLDVLSGGRAMLGVGAAWNEEESRALGFAFPPIAVRLEQLEEALQIVLRMWDEDDAPHRGRHYQLERTLNSPQPLQRPHPPILIGGGGERKTLRLVAKYGDACNLFNGPQLAHKLSVLREHCEREGRDYDAIEKTVLYNFDVGEHGANVGRIIDELGRLAELGLDVAHGSVRRVWEIEPLEIIGQDILPAVAAV